MSQPISDAPNNWIQVKKSGAGFIASVGKETFSDQLKVSLIDGKILSASLDNPVEQLERECMDKDLTHCGEAKRKTIRRQIEISLKNDR